MEKMSNMFPKHKRKYSLGEKVKITNEESPVHGKIGTIIGYDKNDIYPYQIHFQTEGFMMYVCQDWEFEKVDQ